MDAGATGVSAAGAAVVGTRIGARVVVGVVVHAVAARASVSGPSSRPTPLFRRSVRIR